MRPGYLYFSIFIWLVSTGGRFTAPFLQEIAKFDDSMIGITIALCMLIGPILGSIGAGFADRLEFKYPNRGRIGVLLAGLTLSTLSFEIHGLVRFLVDEEQHHILGMGLHLGARILYACFSAIIFPILDGTTLSYLEKHHQTDGSTSYGKERLFGAVGWAIASMLVGPILDSFGFDIFFLTAPAGYLVCLFSTVRFVQDSICYEQISEEDAMSPQTEMVEKEITEQDTITSNDNLDNFVDKKEERNPEVGTMFFLRVMISTSVYCGFIISSLTLNMGTSVVENLIFLFFETLGGSNTMCGITVVVTVIFEIPIFHYAPKLLAYFGAEALQEIACLAYIIRVIAYTCIPKGHMILVLLVEPLHGVTYACSKTSSVEFAARLSPTGYESSGQGVISMIFGIGSVLGLSLGGWIEEALGPIILYRSYAAIVAIGLAIFHITISTAGRGTKHYASVEKQSQEECEETSAQNIT